MLKIVIPKSDPLTGNCAWDEVHERFIITPETTITLEHSLVSLSKWEMEHEKPFMNSTELTKADELDYIRCMTITPNVNPLVYLSLTQDNLNDIAAYMNKKMTATVFSEIQEKQEGKGTKNEIITNEIIYYWMVALQIPFEPCEKWHLNRLLSLIKVVSLKNQPDKKMEKQQQAARYRNTMAARRAKRH